VLAVQSINRSAELIECQNAQVDLEKILGITAFSLDRLLDMDPEFLVSVTPLNM
jgi:G3E family GTPase